ncbi:MAG: DUF3108 domain-containing protein [Hydrogenophilaceae bacterium]|nr:DUF3108 domain-containing protein [Hydrogenophilaceae bacterium]
MAGVLNKSPSRRLLAALAASLLLHLWITGGISLPSFVEVEAPPIEARLIGPSPKTAKAAPTKPAAPQVKPPPQPRTVPAVEPTAEVATVAEPPVEPVPAVAAMPPATPEDVQTEPTPPALPEAFRIRFLVQGNEGGLTLGRLDHIWRRSGDHYSLVGIARATGLFAVFYSGLLSQTSDGRITAAGLRPENYWMQRGKKSYTAAFDWGRSAVRLGGPYGALPVEAGAQDYLSVVYQVALFPRAKAGSVVVVNGKRAKSYRYQELGREVIRLPLGEVEAIHLRIGQGGEEGDMELWLRAQPPQLPIKMYLIDNKGRTGVLLAEAIE